jgi:hypothetical protein
VGDLFGVGLGPADQRLETRLQLFRALLLASLIAGALWEMVGPHATFMAGAAFTAIGLFGTAVVLRR